VEAKAAKRRRRHKTDEVKRADLADKERPEKRRERLKVLRKELDERSTVHKTLAKMEETLKAVRQQKESDMNTLSRHTSDA